MYKELSTQFKYNEETFKNTKSRDLLEITCVVCKENFELTKHQLQTNWRRSTNKILFCSKTCNATFKTIEKVTTNCQHCDKEFLKDRKEYERSENHFCSKSCSASFNNKNRTEESRNKQRETLKKTLENKPKTVKESIKIIKEYNLICKICDKEFIHTNPKKLMCSKECVSLRQKQIHIDHPHVINNRSNPESYLELSFKDYILNTLNIKEEDFIQEKRWIMSNSKLYISDFYFPSLNLIVELDGKQHELTKEEDYNRDNQILREFNSNTLRITHKEWITKERNEELTKLLQPLSN